MTETFKPWNGYIGNCQKVAYYDGTGDNLGYYYEVRFMNHPRFAGKTGCTSQVVAEDGDEVETLYSRYTKVP